jgi:hypothetical protein
MTKESKEVLKTSREEWADLPDKIRDMLNNSLKDTGASNMECFGRYLLLVDPSKDRFAQVNLVLNMAATSVAAEILNRGIDNVGLGTANFSVRDKFKGVVITKRIGENVDLTVQNINEIITKANEILGVFKQPKIPNFTPTNPK